MVGDLSTNGSKENDIALIKTSSEILLSEHVSPICLDTINILPHADKCVVSGWGATSQHSGMYISCIIILYGNRSIKGPSVGKKLNIQKCKLIVISR